MIFAILKAVGAAVIAAAFIAFAVLAIVFNERRERRARDLKNELEREGLRAASRPQFGWRS